MSAYHEKTMDAKLIGDEVNYRKSIATAEKRPAPLESVQLLC